MVLPPQAWGQSPLLQQGINQYKQENFEEAVEILVKVRAEQPESSLAAFFLGMAYKQVMDFPKSLDNFREAVGLRPKIKEALVELIAVLQQLGGKQNLQEAEQWIAVAERDNILPARVAFLKGLVLQKQGRNLDAVASFQKAKSLDDAVAQSADFQSGLSFLKERQFKSAKQSLETAVLRDPQSDLASYARQYIDMVETRMFLERPFRFTLGIFGGYDTNMVLKPTEAALAPGVTNEEAWVMNTSLRASYVPTLQGPWMFNAQYALSSGTYSKNTHTHDYIGHSITVTPGYNFGQFSLNLAVGYNYSSVRDPSYKEYLQSFNAGPLVRIILKQDQILELFLGFHKNEYDKPPLLTVEDRNSEGPDAYVSWVWLFKKGAFFNARYSFADEDTDGENWENESHRFSLSATFPLPYKINLQLTGALSRQDFKNTHTIFGKTRKDKTYQGSIGITRELFKHVNSVAQYSRFRDDSNIGIYDYERDVITVGVEYRF